MSVTYEDVLYDTVFSIVSNADVMVVVWNSRYPRHADSMYPQPKACKMKSKRKDIKISANLILQRQSPKNGIM